LNLVPLAYEAIVPPTPPPQHSLFIFDSPRQSDGVSNHDDGLSLCNNSRTLRYVGVLDHLEADNEGDYTWLQQISTVIKERDRNFATNQKPMNTHNRK
jgi:hypothetical protein